MSRDPAEFIRTNESRERRGFATCRGMNRDRSLSSLEPATRRLSMSTLPGQCNSPGGFAAMPICAMLFVCFPSRIRTCAQKRATINSHFFGPTQGGLLFENRFKEFFRRLLTMEAYLVRKRIAAFG
jgi:hypothetical protein